MGIMGKKNKIVNIEIKGREMFRFRSILQRYFGIADINKILYVIEGKHVYHIILNNGKHIRLDMHEEISKDGIDYQRRKASYHKFAYRNNVNVPKVIGTYITPNGFYKCCVWVKGQRIGYVWNLPHVFQKAGKEIAKINCLKHPDSDWYLGYNDFTKPNAIWTKKQDIFLVDVEIQPKEDITFSVVKILLKNIGDKDRIEWFLRGYSEIRDTEDIVKELKKRNYKWEVLEQNDK